MKKMSEEEYLGFLTSGTKTGKLATVRADGRPHVVPVWFAARGRQNRIQHGKLDDKSQEYDERPKSLDQC